MDETKIRRFHTCDEGTVKTKNLQERIDFKEGKNGCIGRQGNDISFLRNTQDNIEIIG